MPTYEYECADCGHAFEQFQQMSEAPIQDCPKCGGAVHRLIGTGSGIIMKAASASPAAVGATSCGRASPCCGRDVPCDTKPCE
jgi:putative FmdB family regulatory protein